MKFTVIEKTHMEIDMDEEYARVKRCFRGGQLARILKLYDMFNRGMYKECGDFLETWGRCPQLECPEVEFIESDIYTLICIANFSRTKKIYREPEPEKKPERVIDR